MRVTTAGAPSSRRELFLVVAAFLFVHLVIALLVETGPNLPIGDVQIVYRQWVIDGFSSGLWSSIDFPSVYPVLALVPMILASLAGTDHIVEGWLVLMALLNAVAMVFLWRHRVRGTRVVWWWLLFLLLLGPIGQARIDTVATAAAMVGVALATYRPAIASALFTIGAWVKVWPAALIVALITRTKHWRSVVLGAVVVAAAVLAVDGLIGGWANVFSFIGEQAGRGLQIESTLATPFMWASALHRPGVEVYYDHVMLTFQIRGPGAGFATSLSTPLMVVLVAAIVVLTVLALRRHAASERIAPVVALALVMTVIVANKVGSPQYVGWIAVPVVWGLIAGASSARAFRVPAFLALATAVLTQIIYPFAYQAVLRTDWPIVAVLTARNALEVSLLAWAMIALVGLVRTGEHTLSVSADGRLLPRWTS